MDLWVRNRYRTKLRICQTRPEQEACISQDLVSWHKSKSHGIHACGWGHSLFDSSSTDARPGAMSLLRDSTDEEQGHWFNQPGHCLAHHPGGGGVHVLIVKLNEGLQHGFNFQVYMPV